MKQIIKWAGYVLVLLLLVYVAVLYNSVALLAVAVVLFLLPPIELLLLLIQRCGISLSVMQTEEAVTKGDTCHLWLTVTNAVYFPLLLLSLTFVEQNREQQQEVTITLNARESRQYEVSFAMEHCGIKRIRLQKGWLQDYMGWFRIPFSKSLLENCITVYPKEQVQILTLKTSSQNQDTQDETESDKRGQGKDQFLGVRPYISGDSLKHIHWKMSAKQGDLYVREYSEDIRAMHLILLNVPALKMLSLEEQEYAYEAFITLSCSLLEAECSHYAAIIYLKPLGSTPAIKRYSITQKQETRACLYELYEFMEEGIRIRRGRIISKDTTVWTKTQQLAIYNQHYTPFPQECVSCIPE